MSIVQAVLLGILGGFGIWDSRVFGLWMIERPLILGPLVGIYRQVLLLELLLNWL